MTLFRIQKAASVGLFIHQDEIRFLKLRPTKHKWLVEDSEIVFVPKGLIESHKILSLNSISSLIRTIVNKTKSHNCSTGIAIPSSLVLSKQIKFETYLSEEERIFEIQENQNEYFPGIKEDLNIDYFNEENVNEITAVAARAECVKSYKTVAEQAGLNVKIIDIEHFALMRGLIAAVPKYQLISMVIDLDVLSSQIFILQHNKLIFNHLIKVEFKSEQFAEIFIKQFNHAIQLFNMTYPAINLDHLYLSGKTSMFNPIKKILRQNTLLQINILNPFLQMKILNRALKSSIQTNAAAHIITSQLALRGAI